VGFRVLPKKLTHLFFGHSFNQALEEGALPKSLVHLSFGNDFNQQLGLDVLPKKLTHLTFGEFFEQEIDNGVLPTSLTHLSFKDNLDFLFVPERLPRLTHLCMSGEFWAESFDTIFPALSHLTVQNTEQLLFCKNSSVTHLNFDDFFNEPLTPGMFPDSVTHLYLGHGFDSILTPGALPPNLTHLIFGESYDQPLSTGTLPGSLVDLAFGDRYNKPVVTGVLPPNLKSLHFGDWFDNRIPPLPDSLEKIYLNQKLLRDPSIDLPPRCIRLLRDEELKTGWW
jgi:hypothetical protein